MLDDEPLAVKILKSRDKTAVKASVAARLLPPGSSLQLGSKRDNRQVALPRLLRPPPVAAALEYAAVAHGGQRRKDGSLFVLHVIEVAALLRIVRADLPVIVAGVLHDVLERTVAAVSEDESISPYEERKRLLRQSAADGGPDAHAVFAADKVAKGGACAAAGRTPIRYLRVGRTSGAWITTSAALDAPRGGLRVAAG